MESERLPGIFSMPILLTELDRVLRASSRPRGFWLGVMGEPRVRCLLRVLWRVYLRKGVMLKIVDRLPPLGYNSWLKWLGMRLVWWLMIATTRPVSNG